MFSYICAPFQLQLTTSENAAFAVFVMLLARTILSLRPNLYIPISKVNYIYCLDPYVCSLITVYISSLLALIHTHSWNENMQRAQRRDAVNGERFYFPRTNFPNKPGIYTNPNRFRDH